MYKLSDYEYDLPQELIAQRPCSPRDHARLMVVDRVKQSITETRFDALTDILQPGDQLVFNDTKVIPARLLGKRETGGKAEVFLLRALPNGQWEAMLKPGKKLQPGSTITFGDDFSCTVMSESADGTRTVEFQCEGDFDEALRKYGHMPLPPYIQRDDDDTDAEEYQTVYAQNPGAVAAPTAGLHFTDEMLRAIADKGVDQVHLTLHVGAGTFRPVQVDDIRDHHMHGEAIVIGDRASNAINTRDTSKRQICVGTTSCRSIETAAGVTGQVLAGQYDSRLFIYPGYHFKAVDALLTNFHLPGSTLMMLVSALGGYELIKEAYAKAVKDQFRFFSYGDAMLIL